MLLPSHPLSSVQVNTLISGHCTLFKEYNTQELFFFFLIKPVDKAFLAHYPLFNTWQKKKSMLLEKYNKVA